MKKRLCPALLCLAFAGCGGGGVECTALPCPSGGLVVNLMNPPTGPYRVEATEPGNPTVHAQDCGGTSPCSIVFPGFQPAQVHIAVITASGTTTFDKQTTTVTSYPNGPDCMGCSSSHVEVP